MEYGIFFGTPLITTMPQLSIRDIDDLRKRSRQTWFDFEQNVFDVVIEQWRDRLRSRVRAGGGHFEHML